MKKLFISIIFMLYTCTAFCQSKDNYELALNSFKRSFNKLETDSIYNSFSDRIKGMVTKEKLGSSFSSLYTQYGEIVSFEPLETQGEIKNYKTIYSKGILTLVVSLNSEGKFETLRFIPYAEPKKDTQISNFTLETATGTIYGTMTLPATAKKVPVVLLIAGSGPTDRDGNSHLGVAGNTYRLIADSLQKAGIACLRYDKRGVGGSKDAMKAEEDLVFDTYVNDAIGCIQMLKNDTRFSKVIVMGHSEGSLIGMIAARREKVARFISVAGAGERADIILLRQFYANSKEMADKAKPVLDSLVKGFKVQNVAPDLSTIFHPAVQPYIISWLKYDPQKEIKKLKIPVLILQGTTDLQVSVNDAQKLKQADPAASLQIVTGMNHVLKQSTTDKQQNLATYTNTGLPISKELIMEVIKFVMKSS